MLSHLVKTSKDKVKFAQVLRRYRDTSAEYRLWQQIRKQQLGGAKFRRQVAVGPFIADFLCVEVRLIIELDGDSHMGKEGYDERREKFLQEHGYTVLRFENKMIFEDPDAVHRKILTYIQEARRWKR